MKSNKALILAIVSVLSLKQATAQTKYSWSNLPKAAVPTFKKDTFNIVKYGATPDGITLNTKSINAAITDCSAKGGCKTTSTKSFGQAKAYCQTKKGGVISEPGFNGFKDLQDL